MRKYLIFIVNIVVFGLSACQFLDSSETSIPVNFKDSNYKQSNCPTGDCIAHDISSQDICQESVAPRQRDIRWTEGLSLEVDQTILGGDIIAYQIRWFNGKWSKWFVPGINDIDGKYNVQNNKMRRVWSYFYDHEHKYIMCKNLEE